MREKGVVPLLILLAGLGLILFIIAVASIPLKDQIFSKLYPKRESAASSPISTGATFSFGTQSADVTEGQEVPVQILLRSDTHKANLFSAKVNYDKDKLEILNVDTTGTFITTWIERFFDNLLGRASIVGGVPKPGFSTSGIDAVMATLVFRAKASGSAQISYDINSAIYRNNDNVNILTATSGLTLNIQPSAPSPTVTPPVPSPSPIPSPTEIPSPTPTPIPAPCSLISASWISSQNPTDEGAIVTLIATGSGDCNGKQVVFEVREDDGLLGYDPVKLNPANSNFIADTASTSWVAEYQPDGFDGINDPPEYFFIANLTDGTSTINSTAPQLAVNRLPTTVFKKGDANRDGGVDLQDLSIMFSYWFDTSGFPDELDINSDGIINTFDFSSMLLILKAEGVLSNPITQ